MLEDRWWQEATPERIGQAYTTAQAWEGRPEVEPYLARIREQVKERYGVDIDQARDQSLEGQLGEPVGSTERERAEADKDRAEAARLMEDSDRADRTQLADDDPSNAVEADHAQQTQADAELLYDSAERRDALADGLRELGVDAPVVEARVTADTHQATPAAAAIAARPNRAPKARRNRGVRAHQRSDRGR